MNPQQPVFALVLFCIALVTASLLQYKFKIKHAAGRYESIDAFRGFLAIGVFIHHAATWYTYLQTQRWEVPSSNVYAQLGDSCVSFFFMITSFLFVSKLLQAKDHNRFWRTLFVSRFFRIVPLYIFSFLLLLLIVAALSNFQLLVPWHQVVKEIGFWLSFTFIDNPNINACSLTKIINAGVVWSLPYEWLFYFCLPILSLILQPKLIRWPYILLGVLLAFLFYKSHGFYIHHYLSFAGGALAPLFLHYSSKNINFNTWPFSLVVFVCIASIPFFHSTENLLCKVLLIMAFTLIALGNNLFGILRNSALKFLGAISYSTYLLHGILIFVVMHFIMNTSYASSLSPTPYCLLFFLITPILVLCSFLTFHFIESPCMRYVKKRNGKM